jgi:hypothetical protein
MIVAQHEGSPVLCKESGQRATCPECRAPVAGKYGSVVIPHFAHLSSTRCSYGSDGESEWHLRWKYLFVQAGWDLEVRIGHHRADASRGGCVIEFQKRPLSDADYFGRADTYGDEMIWLIDGSRRGIRVTENEQFVFGSIGALGWLEGASQRVIIDDGYDSAYLVSGVRRRRSRKSMREYIQCDVEHVWRREVDGWDEHAQLLQCLTASADSGSTDLLVTDHLGNVWRIKK